MPTHTATHTTLDHPFLTEREQQDGVFAPQRHLYQTEAEYGKSNLCCKTKASINVQNVIYLFMVTVPYTKHQSAFASLLLQSANIQNGRVSVQEQVGACVLLHVKKLPKHLSFQVIVKTLKVIQVPLSKRNSPVLSFFHLFHFTFT